MFSTFFLTDLPPDITEPSLLKRLGNGIVVAVSLRDSPTGTVAMVEAPTEQEAEHAAVAFGQSNRGADPPLTVITGETPEGQQLGLYFASCEEDAQRAGGTCWASSTRVMIVDDDPVCLQGMQDLLAFHLPHVCVDLADSGDMAMDLVRTREFDAVLSDVQMPGLDGFSLIGALKGIKPQTPVVLMTGNPNLLARMVASGAFGFIRKPVDRKHCVSALQHAFMYCALSKLAGHAKQHTKESLQARAGLRSLAETELDESRKRWNPW
jgi:DNA-binding NarL/FixJ family response regulator